MSDGMDIKIHRHRGPGTTDFDCKDQNCDYPQYSSQASMEQAMEHVRDTGHEVFFKVVDLCIMMPEDKPVKVPTAKEYAEYRGIDLNERTKHEWVPPRGMQEVARRNGFILEGDKLIQTGF